jgi:hypothetical protein
MLTPGFKTSSLTERPVFWCGTLDCAVAQRPTASEHQGELTDTGLGKRFAKCAEYVEGPGFNNGWVGKVTTCTDYSHLVLVGPKTSFSSHPCRWVFVEEPQQKSGMGE